MRHSELLGFEPPDNAQCGVALCAASAAGILHFQYVHKSNAGEQDPEGSSKVARIIQAQARFVQLHIFADVCVCQL